MDETMGRRTVGGLLFTKGGSILVYREDSPRRKATGCCTRLGCSSNLFPDKGRKVHHRVAKEEVTPRKPPHGCGKSKRMHPEGRMAYDSASRNVASTCGETGNRPRREPAGKDLLARLKDRVNASRKRSLSGGSSPSSAITSSTGSSGSSRLTPRSLHRPATKTRKDGRNDDAVRVHKVSRGSARGNMGKRNEIQDPSGRMSSRSLFTHRSRVQGGRLSYLEDSLDDSNGYCRFNMDERDEVQDYHVSNDRHREMRMDIDDMSYEELLALGDRIGTVSTGLSDDALSECLERILYIPTTSTSHEDGDIKCIICQEEYLSGEEVAKIACKHYYHFTCIQHWLRQKNWCPICKTVASADNSPCTLTQRNADTFLLT